MDSTVASLSAAGLILVISIVAAYMPFRFTDNPKLQTRVLTLSAGIMIGVLFVMMIPETLDRIEAEGHDHVFCSELMMAGFLFVLLIGYLLHLISIKNDRDDISSRSTWIGFCVDAVIDGAVVATGLNVGGGTEIAILIAMCLHKGVEVFALANQVVSGSDTASAKKMMAIYCLICPLSLIVFGFLFTQVLVGISGPALCFSAGIFMYAALAEMVPGAFEGENRNSLSTVVVFALGIAITLVVNYLTAGL
jgi:zinc transporter ZupT